MNPKLEDYPKWLRERIKVPLPRSAQGEEESSVRELEMVFRASRQDPVCKVLFNLVIDVIRLKFTVWALRGQVAKMRYFTPKEIQALKALAAQKMNEATPEEEEEWERALDDPWGRG